MASSMHTVLWVAGGTGAVVLGAILFTLIVRFGAGPGGRHGAAVLGGILAGLLLGPGIAGRVAPEPWARAFIGAGAEREAYEAMGREHAVEVRAVEEAGVTPIYVEELRARHTSRLDPLRAEFDRALDVRRSLLGAIAGALLGAHILGAGLIFGSLRPERRTAPWRGASIPDALGAGALMLVTGVIAPAIAVIALLGVPAPVALAIGLAMGAPALGMELPPRLWPGAMLGIMLSALGIGWLIGGPLGAPPLGTILGGATLGLLLLAARPGGRVPRRVRRALSEAMLLIALPGALALATIRCDPGALASSRTFWVVGITALLLAADGRWLGAAWAQRLFPGGTGMARPGARAWTGATALVNAGTSAAQLAIALILHETGVVDADVLAGLILGVVAIETMRPLRARVGRMMDEPG